MFEYQKFKNLIIYSAYIHRMSTLCQVLLDSGDVIINKINNKQTNL